MKRLAAAWFAAVWFAAGWVASAASPATCAPCHRPQTQRFVASGMARAFSTGKDTALFFPDPRLLGQVGCFTYVTEVWGSAPVVTVIDPQEKQVDHTPIHWVFGAGSVGQTFVFERRGRWYESLVSYYAPLKKLEITMGAHRAFTDHKIRVVRPGEAYPD